MSLRVISKPDHWWNFVMEIELVPSQMVRNLILSTVFQHHLASGIHRGNRLSSFLVGLLFSQDI